MIATIFIALAVYLIGVLFTGKMIADSYIPEETNQSNLSLFWSVIWPIFWIKTIPIFLEISREEKASKVKEKK